MVPVDAKLMVAEPVSAAERLNPGPVLGVRNGVSATTAELEPL